MKLTKFELVVFIIFIILLGFFLKFIYGLFYYGGYDMFYIPVKIMK